MPMGKYFREPIATRISRPSVPPCNPAISPQPSQLSQILPAPSTKTYRPNWRFQGTARPVLDRWAPRQHPLVRFRCPRLSAQFRCLLPNPLAPLPRLSAQFRCLLPSPLAPHPLVRPRPGLPACQKSSSTWEALLPPVLRADRPRQKSSSISARRTIPPRHLRKKSPSISRAAVRETQFRLIPRREVLPSKSTSTSTS